MDRPEPGLIKWSPTPTHDRFLHINLQQGVAQVYEPTGKAQRSSFEFRRLSKHEDLHLLTTYDWSPSNPGLVAVGTSVGVVNLLRVDDDSNAYLDLPLRVSRLCHAVAFNTGHLLAVGLDRVRNDQCLHIWDVNRFSAFDVNARGFSGDQSTVLDSPQRLEPSVAVSSVKFFEDSPQTLAVGIKNQGIRIYDLRDPHGSVINYQTRLNNNLAIDYADQNYFASSALDHPAVVIWDRRATSRHISSQVYLDAVDNDDLPWGATLKSDKAIDVQPELFTDRHSLIRTLRFCRDHRGLLAVLSRTGQLKVTDTQKEYMTSDMHLEGSPELLQARKSYELDLNYLDQDKKTERIVSFDWVTLNSPHPTPRILVLRANGAFDILEKPSYASEHVYKMVPWQSPYRGLEEGTSYHGLMQFESHHRSEMLGPLLVQQALVDIPLFGEGKVDIDAVVHDIIQSTPVADDYIQDALISSEKLPDDFKSNLSVAEKLRALRSFSKVTKLPARPKTPKEPRHESPEYLVQKLDEISLSRTGLLSNRQLHERLLASTMDSEGYPKDAQILLDHVPLFRANSKYLFNPVSNRDIVSDDPWLRDLWDWIAGAEQDTLDDGMVSAGLDLSYMGARTIWSNDLGAQKSTRLAEGLVAPDRKTWERCLRTINHRFEVPAYDGTETKWPAHRQACIRICALGRSTQTAFSDYEKTPASDRNSSWYTMASAQALFSGNSHEAVQILKKASTEHPELLFVSLALQLIGRGDASLAKEQLDFDDAVASKTDPYLRAISSLIATSDWETIANQESLPLRERAYVAFRYFDDDKLTNWLDTQVAHAIQEGDIEGIILTGITDQLVDIFAMFVEKFSDVQTATLVMSICAPRYIDDYRCLTWRNAYRAYLQRHRAFYQRTKFEVESTKKSKRDGVPTVKPPSRQIALRCVYCDAEYELSKTGTGIPSSVVGQKNPLMATNINAGVSCPNCGRHLPRCVVCLEVVGVPRNDKPGVPADPERRIAARFPTFCLKCEHVTHLDHARQWFARHVECPVPECRCRCNFTANPDLNYH
ncbi:WD repeat domain-containing protein [Xylariales sp. PMI_506]|nr:WD repeat domain-containing protein [Xylariales sp. PMI_506]